MKRILVLVAVLATAAIAATPAFAGSASWDGQTGNGADNLPCEVGGFWVLSPGADVGTATLTVNGVVVGDMVQAGGGDSAYQLASSGALDENSTASVSWTGSSTEAFLKLSHCAEGTTGGTTTGETTGETSGGTSSGGSSSGGSSSGGSSSGGSSSGGSSSGGSSSGGATTGGSGGVSGATTGGTTGGTASTPSGGNLPFTGLPVWMPLLIAAAMLGSGIFMIRRRKGELS
jgi:hypothetical protein